MLGFKNFACAATTITGIELLRRIRKDQFALGRLNLNGQAAPAVWNSVLAAGAYARVLSCPLPIFALEPYPGGTDNPVRGCQTGQSKRRSVNTLIEQLACCNG